jgi:hypothetical protein
MNYLSNINVIALSKRFWNEIEKKHSRKNRWKKHHVSESVRQRERKVKNRSEFKFFFQLNSVGINQSRKMHSSMRPHRLASLLKRKKSDSEKTDIGKDRQQKDQQQKRPRAKKTESEKNDTHKGQQ